MIAEPQTTRPFEKPRAAAGSPALEQLEAAIEQDRQDRRRVRRALLVAAAIHLALFFVAFPELEREPLQVGSSAPKAYVVQQVRFQPPAVRPQQSIPKKSAKKIPIPDPTPDEPEPILTDRLEPDLDLPEVDTSALDGYYLDNLPSGPPSRGLAGPVMQVTGNVLAPQKVYAPTPVYTEEARLERIQGVVILQAVIDREGNVADVTVLKGLPAQLTERAVETVKSWRFKPATLEGEPVAVYYNLTISFSLA